MIRSRDKGRDLGKHWKRREEGKEGEGSLGGLQREGD